MEETSSISFQALVGFGLAGAALILGLTATLLNIRTARGPGERRYLIWTCIGNWMLLTVTISLIFLLQPPWRYMPAVAFLIFPFLIYRISIRRQLIREAESHQP